MWRVAEYYVAEDTSAAIQTGPSGDSKYVGSAFLQQTPTGALNIGNADDRASYLASDYNNSSQVMPLGLGQDTDGVGLQSVYGGTVFSGLTYGDRQDNWYTTERPNAGFPLSNESDTEYANRTNDMAGDTVSEEVQYLATVGQHNISERALNMPQRFSAHPAEVQAVRPWDIVLGSWPWTGEKASMQRPSAATPQTFNTALPDPMPTGGGTSNADLVGQYNVLPRPLTFRLPPEPWDIANDGSFVDSGN